MFPSPSQADIARRNGALSQGPVTAAGKARASANATRHGLCARTLILGDGEDKAEFTALRAAMLRYHRPADEAQAHWVEELVFVAWRQERLRALEAAVLARAMIGIGGGLAAPPLPHHRAYGSVHGGSSDQAAFGTNGGRPSAASVLLDRAMFRAGLAAIRQGPCALDAVCAASRRGTPLLDS